MNITIPTFKNHIILDHLESWPSEIKTLLLSMEENLKKYKEIKDKEIKDYLTQNTGPGIMNKKIQKPKNDYDKYWKEAINEIETILQDYSLVGFHCTRLVDHEITDLQKNGLMPLCPLFNKKRVEILVNKKIIEKYAANTIIQKNESDSDNRKGNVFFFICLSTLKDELGLYRLFRSWGGEAMYFHHENNAQILEALNKIGTPCIIMCSINLNKKIEPLFILKDLAKRIINIWLNPKKSRYEDSDLWTNYPLKVIKIIKRNEKLFEQLTDCNNWDYKI